MTLLTKPFATRVTFTSFDLFMYGHDMFCQISMVTKAFVT